jgi:hypothetical protein
VLAVGERVFVHCPGNPSGSVTLGDARGKVSLALHLVDGAEVEVVAWLPRGAGEARYRVRAASNGADGWLSADHLRRTLAPAPPPEPSPGDAKPVADTGVTRFGRRAGLERAGASESTLPTLATPSSDAAGRRFGQRF